MDSNGNYLHLKVVWEVQNMEQTDFTIMALAFQVKTSLKFQIIYSITMFS